MDPFAQRMLEKAEQRSRALGISNASTISANVDTLLKQQQQQEEAEQEEKKLQLKNSTPISTSTIDYNNTNKHLFAQASTGHVNKLQVVEKKSAHSPSSQNKILRHFSAMDKENMEVGIEINIMADKNMEVQVQVEEQEITDGDLTDANEQYDETDKMLPEPAVRIRDSSRNRLQRLGALYSNTDDLSSPIHRTEGKFHAESNLDDKDFDTSPKKINKQQRLGKLAALASTINQWEDDLSHPSQALKMKQVVPPPKPDLPSRQKAQAPQPPTPRKTPTKIQANETSTKNLQWDQKVINSLEAQGFQRRESSTVKYAYDYKKLPSEETLAENDVTEIELPAKGAGGIKKIAQTFDNKQQEAQKSVKQGLVSGRAAVFEKASQNNQQKNMQKPEKDPTELSMKERRLLFERNKGEALVPKAAFGMAPSINKIRQEVTTVLKKDEEERKATAIVKQTAERNVFSRVAALVNAHNNNSEQHVKNDIQKQRQEEMAVLANRFNKQKEVFGTESKVSTKTVRAPPPPPPLPPASYTPEALKRRSPGNSIDNDDDESKRARKTEKLTTNNARLYPGLSDFEQSDRESQHPQQRTSTTASAQSSQHNEEEQRRAHNCHSPDQTEDDDDEDSNESYMEEDDLCNVSLGREIMQVVQKNEHRDREQQQQEQHHYQQKQQEEKRQIKEVRYAETNRYYESNEQYEGEESSLNSSETSTGVDDLLDEAMGDDDFTQDEETDVNISNRSKGTITSNSFSFRKAPGNNYVESHESTKAGGILKEPVKSHLTVNEHEDENLVTLVHTVSFYRRQQNTNSASSTPIRKVTREKQVYRPLNMPSADLSGNFDTHADNGEDDDDESTTEENNEHLVQAKIKKLLDEVSKQQTIISQTSQALNLCAATVEFSGSTESVEGERHLLVATHRRQVCLDEVQRLRVEKSLRPEGSTREKGRLTVKEITIPLRQDYIRKLAADTISGHHLVCLLKYNEHVLATRTVPTLPGLVTVKFPDVLTLNNVYADFRITLEIYGMTAQREILPHEVKYHINLPKKSGIKTPKKGKSDNRLVMPPVQSPAGPQAVRTPALVQYGFAIFSLREIQRTTWTLTQVRDFSPLDGVVHMKVNCELTVSVEHKGFLTMFEDISGFGAWHRRWCHLNGSILNYWKYPDDEKKRTPLGSIDLYTCSTLKVSTAPRDICARLHTMLVECQRPAKDTDQESLIIVPNGRTTIVRHLWSADTKEEREEWCAHLNKALTLLRAWGPPQ